MSDRNGPNRLSRLTQRRFAASAGLWLAAAIAAAMLAAIVHSVVQDGGGDGPQPGQVGPASSQSLITMPPEAQTQAFSSNYHAISTKRFDPPPKATDKIVDRVAGPATAGPGDVMTFSKPFLALDARSFGAGPWTVMLGGVNGPERDSVCLNAQNQPFACGLAGRAAITNALREETATCRLLHPADGDVLTMDCDTSKGDLATLLARQGWLRPNAEGKPSVEDASRLAAAERLGMWNGGWRLRLPHAE